MVMLSGVKKSYSNLSGNLFTACKTFFYFLNIIQYFNESEIKILL
jgi:hypothetical protein